MPQVLQAVLVTRPDLEIHRIEASVPEQCRLLADGRLDVGFGRASRVRARSRRRYCAWIGWACSSRNAIR